MQSFLDQLRQRVEEAQREHEAARLATVDAKNREDAIAADLAGYQRALEAELKRTGATAAATEAQAIAAQDEAESGVSAAVLDPSGGTKTDLVENMIRSRLDGMVPPEVFKELNRLGFPTHRNYVYAILNRLVSRNLIQQRNGRYVGVPKADKPSLFKAS
jgi:hypothetical protein